MSPVAAGSRSAAGKPRRCRDCPPGLKRPAPYAGPRCKTHHLARRNSAREVAWARRMLDTYGITPEQYWAVYEAQGGTCYGCQRATGKTKRLAVDHDHRTGEVRGLLCTPCNRGVLGHLRDDPAALRRLADYIENPPARRVLLSGKDAA